MIASFGDPATEDLFHGRRTSRARRFSREVARAALLKLDALNAATDLADLSSPPGNRLEPLRGGLREFFSVRVNAQWRIIFRWQDRKAFSVSLVDYHS
jgi:proteic killer suppression protein